MSFRHHLLLGLLLSLTAVAHSQDSIAEIDLNGRIPAAIHEAHGKLFNKDQPINRLQLLIAEDSPARREISVRVGPGERFGNPNDPPTPEKELKRMVCSADSIAVVLVGESESSFSSHRDWVYTDYLAKVQAVIKNQKPIETGHLIVIGLGGGELEIAAGKRLIITDEPRPTKGKEYLAFLRYVPESGQYINCGALFSIDGERLTPLASDDHRFLNDISRHFSLTTFAEFVRNQSCPR